jgi:hypothetical protein
MITFEAAALLPQKWASLALCDSWKSCKLELRNSGGKMSSTELRQATVGHLMPDHVHMCIAILPKNPVVSVIGFLKGKSAIAIARLRGRERNFSGEHFWARGCPTAKNQFVRAAPAIEEAKRRTGETSPLVKL